MTYTLKTWLGTVGDNHPIAWVELHLREDSCKKLRIFKKFYKFNEAFSALTLEEGCGPSVIEEWDKARLPDGTFIFTAVLDAEGESSVESTIMRFEIVSLQPGRMKGKSNTTVMTSLPPIIKYYGVGSEVFMDYD